MRGRINSPPLAITQYARASASGVTALLCPKAMVGRPRPGPGRRRRQDAAPPARQTNARLVAEAETSHHVVHRPLAERETDFGGADVGRVGDDVFQRLAAAVSRQTYVFGAVD